MGHPGHQPAQCRQLLRLDQLVLRRLQLADAFRQLVSALGHLGLQLVHVAFKPGLGQAQLLQGVADGLQVLVGQAHQQADFAIGMAGGLMQAGLLRLLHIHPGN